MMNFDSRTGTGIPTEPVGSIPRPLKLQQAYAAYDAKKITKDQLEAEQNAAVADTLKRFEATGSPIITDGEQRVSSFATYPIADTLAGSGLAPNLGPGGQYFAIFADGHNRQLPKLTGGPFRYNFYAGDLVKKAVKMTSRPLHQAVIAPSMMYLLYQLDGDISGYPRKQFEDDIVKECERDIRSCFDAGAAHVVMDFTEGRLAPRNDPRNPWTTRHLLPFFIELDNRVLDRFSAEERKNIGVHVCPGGDVDSVHSADVPYEELLKHLFKLNAGYFQLQMASERDREAAYKLVGKYLREDANGTPQMAYIGCIVTQSPHPEAAQEVCDQLVAAAKHIDKQRLGSTDDCGFSPFSIDTKPNHGSPDYARDIAFQKITNRVTGTKMAAEKLGVH
jgi:methionine synthase II (cobalamin-independent)